MKLYKPIYMPSWWDTKRGEKIDGRMLYTHMDLRLVKSLLAYNLWWMERPRCKDDSPDMRYRVNKEKYGTKKTTSRIR